MSASPSLNRWTTPTSSWARPPSVSGSSQRSCSNVSKASSPSQRNASRSGASSASPAFSPPLDPCGAIAAASLQKTFQTILKESENENYHVLNVENVFVMWKFKNESIYLKFKLGIAAHDRHMEKMARAKAETEAQGGKVSGGCPPRHRQQASIMKSNSATPASLKMHSWSGRRTPGMNASPRWERCSSAASSALTAPQPTRPETTSDARSERRALDRELDTSLQDLNIGEQQGFREDPLGARKH